MGGAVGDGSGSRGWEGQWGMGNNEHEYQQSCMHHYNSREVSQYSHRGGILLVFSEVELHVSWMSS